MKNLIAQLHTLKTVDMNKTVRALQRETVLSHVPFTSEKQSYARYFFTHPFVLKPMAYVAALVLLIVGGSSYTMSATLRSLPGGTFYPVKLQFEKLQVTLTADEVAKTKKQIAYTDRRFSEFTNLSESSVSAVDKQEQVAQVVRHFNDSLQNIKSSLDSVNTDDGQIVDIAQMVNDKSQEYEKQLAGYYQDLPITVKSVLEQEVENVKYQSLEVLVSKYQLAGSQISKETLVGQLQEKLISLGESVSTMSGEKQTEALEKLSVIQELLGTEDCSAVVDGINMYELWVATPEKPVEETIENVGEVLGVTEIQVITSTPEVIE